MDINRNINLTSTTNDADFIDKLVYEWLRRSVYFKKFRLTNSILKSTAQSFGKILYLDSFSANSEWVEKFRLKYKLKNLCTAQLSNITYGCKKSTVFKDIFNELTTSRDPILLEAGDQDQDQDQRSTSNEFLGAVSEDKMKIHTKHDVLFEDTRIIDVNHEEKERGPKQDITMDEFQINTSETNNMELFDIEDQLPVFSSKSKKNDKKIPATIYDVDFLETLMYEWIRRSMYFKNFRLSNSILMSAAVKFNSILNLENFSPCKEWLQKFRKTYNFKNVYTSQLSDISYKSEKSILPKDIFNELRLTWELLDPSSLNSQHSTVDLTSVDETSESEVSGSSKSNEINEEISYVNHEDKNKDETVTNKNDNQSNNVEFLDIEDELPVCTIFGRNTVKNVASIISSNTNSSEDKFQPMIVCTDPKNPNLNLVDNLTKEKSFSNSANVPEIGKIKEFINGKVIENNSNVPNQNEFFDEYLKEIVSLPQAYDTTYSNKLSLKNATEIDKLETCKPVFKPISMSHLRTRRNKPKQQLNVEKFPEALKKAIDTIPENSNEQEPLTSPNRKRKNEINELNIVPKTMNLESNIVHQTPIENQVNRCDLPLSSPIQSPQVLQPETTETFNQMSPVIQPTWNLTPQTFNHISTAIQPTCNPNTLSNTLTLNIPKETTTQNQTSILPNATIMYTLQISEPNPNHPILQYVSPIATNLQSSSFGQSTTLTPIVLHFNSPMPLQTTEFLPGSEMSPTSTISILQPTFVPTSIDLTQQISSNIENSIQQSPISPTMTNNISKIIPTENNSPATKPINVPVSATAQAINSTLKSSTSNTPLTTLNTIMPSLVPTKKSTISVTPIRIPISEMPSTETASSVPIDITPKKLERIRQPVSGKTKTKTKNKSTSNTTNKTPTMSNITSTTKTITCRTNSPTNTTRIQPILNNVITITPISNSISPINSTPTIKKVFQTSEPTIPSMSNISLTKITNPLPKKIPPTTSISIQPHALPESPTVTSTSTLNLSKTTPTSRINYEPIKNISTTITRLQPSVCTKESTTHFSEAINSTAEVRSLQLSISTVKPNVKSMNPMGVTITKKSRLRNTITTSTTTPVTTPTPTTIQRITPTTTNSSNKRKTKYAQRSPLKSQEEVLKCIKLMEDFAMMNEDFRLIGFLERLEKHVIVNKIK